MTARLQSIILYYIILYYIILYYNYFVGNLSKTAGEQPPDRRLYSVDCANSERCDCITLELDVNQGYKLHFLVDSGADISLAQSYKFLGTAKFEPKDKVRVKSVEGSVVETHGSFENRIREGGIDVLFRFQQVSQKVDVKGEGILGRNFFKLMQTRICYKQRLLTFRHAGFLISKKLRSLLKPEFGAFQGVGVGKLTLPARTEVIVQLPVSGEGL